MSDVFEAATAADGISPLNESGRLVLAGERPGHVTHTETAAAVVDLRDRTIMLAVHPQHRRRGHGTRLLRSLLADHPDLTVWAFGSLPGSASTAAHAGLVPRRTLLQMARSLDDVEQPSPDPRIDHFRPGDEDAIVDINARAFAHHPEQGRLTRAEFDQLTRQPWFDPQGLLIARSAGAVVGFHWTKRHAQGVGEVYVIAVDPDHEGQGIGRSLLAHGLAHLQRRGDHRVELFVEGDQTRVVEMYQAAGFHVVRRDTSYGRAR